eukprot:6702882-Alexandrium_andersonii.AAC.1
MREQADLARYYTQVILRWGPQDGGFPTERRRTLMAGINKSQWVWVGPRPEDVEADFCAKFGRPRVLTGDAYMLAEDSAVYDFLGSIAANCKKTFPKNWRDKPFDAFATTFLSPGRLQRLTEYRRAFEQSSSAHPWLADLDHHPCSGGPAHGRNIPTLDTHPFIYSLTHGRPLVPSELFASQGFDVFPQISGKRPPCGLMD